MFSDFQKLELDHFAEMDTVHSSQESKRVILTFFLTREKLFLAFIMNRCTKMLCGLLGTSWNINWGPMIFSLYSTRF